MLGGKTVRSGEPSFVALANAWIVINVGGGPTDDKPAVTLTAPDPNTTSSFLNIRVANIQEVYDDWTAKGRSPASTHPCALPASHQPKHYEPSEHNCPT